MVFVAPEAARAEAWRFEPAATVETNLDDNRRLSVDDPKSTWTTRLLGGLRLSRLTEITTVVGGFQYSYETTDGDSAIEDRAKFLLNGGVQQLISERQRGGVNATITRDSTVGELRAVSLVNVDEVGVETGETTDEVPAQEEVPPEEPADTTGDENGATVVETGDVDDGLVDVDVQRTRVSVAPFWSFRATERTTLGVQYRFTGLYFDGDQGTGLRESTSHSISPRISYKLSQRDTMTASGGYTLKMREDTPDTRAYSVTVGYNRQLSDISRVGATFGAFRTERDGDDDSGRTGTLYAFDYRRTLISGSVGGRAERKLAPSGTGDLVANDLLQVNYQQTLRPRLAFNLAGRFQRSESAEVDTTSSRDFFSIEPALRWKASRWSALRLSYRYRYKDDDRSGSADSNSVFLTFTYSRAADL